MRLAHADIVIVGAGPAGLAAACAATSGYSGQSVILIDENPAPGGQVWRGEGTGTKDPEAAALMRTVEQRHIQRLYGTAIIHAPESGVLVAMQGSEVGECHYRKLILATGSRELFLPFPGWTLPNVMGAGGLQALMKGGLSVRGKKIVVAGSGPLLLAAAAQFMKAGAEIPAIIEQAEAGRVQRFGLTIARHLSKFTQLLDIRRTLGKVPYYKSAWVVEAMGSGTLSAVIVRRPEGIEKIECDYLACGYHLVPNLELAALVGCGAGAGGVTVNEMQETSVPGIFAAGEITGIGGADLVMAEGAIAGAAASGDAAKARREFSRRAAGRRFADAMNAAFALRDELCSLPTNETIFCRCEDVTFGAVRNHESWRAAKLQTRCGMGACQGRVCAQAAQYFFDWDVYSRQQRPPLSPVRVDALIRENSHY